MKKRKYTIDESFKKWENFKTPINRFMIIVGNFFLNFLFHFQRTNKEITVKKIKIPFLRYKIKTILYSPKNASSKMPCLIYYHGGGFVFKGSLHHYKLSKEYCLQANCHVLYVDYPTAPKNKFPLPIDACYKVYEYIQNNKELYNISEKIIVGGDSAGGEIALVMTLMAHDQNFVIPSGVMAMYPVCKDSSNSNSMKEYWDTPLCNSLDIKKYHKLYVGDTVGGIYHYLSPLDAPDFSFFPKTYIEVAEFDCLRDDAIELSKKLAIANVDVILNDVKGTMHGYDICLSSPITLDSINKRVSFLKSIVKEKAEV